MRYAPRLWLIGFCLLVLLTTCSAPWAGDRAARISGFVAPTDGVGGSGGPPAAAPTIQPTVTPGPGQVAPESASVGPPGGLVGAAAPVNDIDPRLVAAAEAIDTHLRSLSDSGYFRGSVLVAYQGRVLISRGYGLANQDVGLANSPLTRFRLASVSKPLTALAIMQLAEQGKLNLQASICTYLPDCPPAWGGITTHHLLSHTSGIPNYTDFANFPGVEQLPASPDQVIDRFRGMGLGFSPGEGFQYCNSNYVLLGRIIERVSGQYYADYMRDQIFTPLAMADSGYDQGDAGVLNGTLGYAGGGARAIPIDTSNLFAAGGLYSTVEDLYRLAQALDQRKLLRPETAALIYQPVANNFGYGWKVEERFGRLVYYHPGLMSGAATYLARYPNNDLTVIVLSNQETVDAQGIGEYLAGLVLG